MRDQTLRKSKHTLRRFFSVQPVDYLTRVADECRAGRVGYHPRCYCIRGLAVGGYDANTSDTFMVAEVALCELAIFGRGKIFSPYAHQNYAAFARMDDLVRVRTLPIVLAEISRRQRTTETIVNTVEAPCLQTR